MTMIPADPFLSTVKLTVVELTLLLVVSVSQALHFVCFLAAGVLKIYMCI